MVTLDTIVAKKDELVALIEQFKSQPQPAAAPAIVLQVPAVEIELKPGETYCGPLFDAQGQVEHYLILLPHDDAERDWNGAQSLATERGGFRPTRREARLLTVQASAKLPASFWTDDAYNASNAWYCHSNGYQNFFNRSAELGAVAVRRVKPSILRSFDPLIL